MDGISRSLFDKWSIRALALVNNIDEKHPLQMVGKIQRSNKPVQILIKTIKPKVRFKDPVPVKTNSIQVLKNERRPNQWKPEKYSTSNVFT